MSGLYDGMKCDCCGATEVMGVASSSLGAISFAWCRECIMRGAEPLSMLLFVYETTNEGKDAATFVQDLVTWVEGEYIKWPEVITRIGDGRIKYEPTPEPPPPTAYDDSEDDVEIPYDWS